VNGDGHERAAVAGPGGIFRLIRDGIATTRAELVDVTGLARSTVSQRVEALLAHELVVPAGESSSTGGRRPSMLAFNASAGVVLAADLGATHCHAAVTDLAGDVVAETAYDIAIAEGAETILPWLVSRFDELLAEAGHRREDVRGVGVGLPGPVEFASGRPVNPPLMPGWNDFRVGDYLREELGAPALVDNDVNVMAQGERWLNWRSTDHLLFVKVGTGIGCGIVAGGQIHRGADGAARDLGHCRVRGADTTVCRCGNTGCLEAVAGGGAIAAQLTALGVETVNAREVVAHVRVGQPDAVRLVRQAGRDLGDALTSIVNFFNPTVIVFGGEMAEADEQLLAGVREVVYQRSLPLATRNLGIVRSAAGPRAGVVGASVMVIEHILSPAVIDEALDTHAAGVDAVGGAERVALERPAAA
jgi:predicted NBD/HSP70 family sugar kinase